MFLLFMIVVVSGKYWYCPKGVFGKGAGNSKKNASKMRGKRGTFQNASEMRQNCVKNARNTFGGERLLDDTENTPWAASACADCPGFLVLVLLLPRLPPWSQSLRLCCWASILLYGPLDIAWNCCPQLPHQPCKNGTHGTCFYSTGAHAHC